MNKKWLFLIMPVTIISFLIISFYLFVVWKPAPYNCWDNFITEAQAISHCEHHE